MDANYCAEQSMIEICVIKCQITWAILWRRGKKCLFNLLFCFRFLKCYRWEYTCARAGRSIHADWINLKHNLTHHDLAWLGLALKRPANKIINDIILLNSSGSECNLSDEELCVPPWKWYNDDGSNDDINASLTPSVNQHHIWHDAYEYRTHLSFYNTNTTNSKFSFTELCECDCKIPEKWAKNADTVSRHIEKKQWEIICMR